MSMEHKAYLFDTLRFMQELKKVLDRCKSKQDIEPIRKFINAHLTNVKSPYDGESLDIEWERQLETKEIQEYADFALTNYYLPEEDYGLEYSWDALLEVLRKLELNYETEYYILGKSISLGIEILDPGGCGLGIVLEEDIPNMLVELIRYRDKISNIVGSIEEDVLYELTEEEVLDAYEELCQLYNIAKEAQMGLLFTF